MSASGSDVAEAKPLVRSPFRRKNFRPRVLVPVAASLWVLWAAQPTVASLAVGGALVAAGQGLRVWAAGHLHKTHALTFSGPYAHLRNPLYAGTLWIGCGFLAMAGWPVARLGVPLFLLFFFRYYLPYKERVEGDRLEQRHGVAYRRYRQAVRSLWPRLRPWRTPGPPSPAGWRLSRLRDNDELGAAAAVASCTTLLVLRLLMPT